jgi:putative transposase
MPKPPKGSSQLRKGRISLPGTIYFITKNTLERLEEGLPYEAGVLLAEGVPEIIMDSLEWLEEQGNLEWLAYVIMPDHLHLLFKLKEQEPLSKIMYRFSHFTSRQINLKQERQGSIWQEGYYDRAIRDEDELQKAFTYIHNNPVKAGYVDEINDWAWLYPKLSGK